MMSALRRIYDGEYTRQLGIDGGVTLEWRGKAGCIFGATQKYDSHHAVVGTLGDRFQLFRIDAMPDEQLKKCQLRPGERTIMRRELAQAVTDLFASLPDPLPVPERMSASEYETLAQTVRLAIRLRAGVVRDGYKREIDDVHDPEGPARFILALQQEFAGLVLIGVSRAEAYAIVEQIVFDSTPRLRLKAFRALTGDWRSTGEIASRINLPSTPARRALEELAAQGLALREDRLSLLVTRRKGRVGGVVECWKLAPRTAALSHPKST
jgi:hypothetical protein